MPPAISLGKIDSNARVSGVFSWNRRGMKDLMMLKVRRKSLKLSRAIIRR